MLYTRKGDNGTTKLFNSPPGQRISKSSCQTEALGSMDELNSFLGLVKVKSGQAKWYIDGKTPAVILEHVQDCLFTIQAQMAGADKTVTPDKVIDMEKMIDLIEATLPPIKTFLISGGTELSALFDVARTWARRVERRVIEAYEKNETIPDPNTLSYLNRLSSLLYALARQANNAAGLQESAPCYN